MADYAAMYKKLFNSQTDAIRILQEAQKATEEMYMSAADPELSVVDFKKQGEPEKEKEADHEDTD
ncbi:hypothetical protein LJC34_00115 [Oscillospiraceae bacterium OttesenSCG-928-G22]|nr:hypothetical protein [Oscillospiraceae bacterium OttesenSCG-928-G22]